MFVDYNNVNFESNFISERFDELSEKMHLGKFLISNFNVESFAKINSFLLQDLVPEAYNENLYNLRSSTSNFKHRMFANVGYGFGSYAVYSDKKYPELVKECSDCLDNLNKSKSKLSADQFIEQVSKAFATLDHAHIFTFANGATIKLLLNRFALNYGYEFQWNTIQNDPVKKELFYVARDREVNEISLTTSVFKSQKLDRAVKNNEHYSKNIPLSDFVKSVCVQLDRIQNPRPVKLKENNNFRNVRRCR